MSGLIGTFMANAQQAADTAKQAKDMQKAQKKTQDGRRIYKIACLGNARSGKTTFWSVLHEATRGRMDEFNIQSGDNTTAAYLVRQRDAMQAGAFYIPAPGEKPADYEPGYPAESDLLVHLLFMAREGGGKEVPVMVQDYPGRAIGIDDSDGRSQEVVEFLKTSDAVLFFVDSFSTRESPHKLNEQLLAFGSLLKHIEDRHGRIHRPVGLVLTKGDTLDEYRPANPVELITDSDQRRRGEVYSKFLAQLLKNSAFVSDPAWKARVEKTLTRLRSFADALLKKCEATQFFVVSAVGDKRRRPIEPVSSGDSLQASFTASTSSSAFVVGRNETGMIEPVRWILRQLTVKTQVRKADKLRNGALAVAAAYSLILSLPFLLYLGCAVPRLEGDLKKEPIPALQVMKDVRGLEENYFAKFWSTLTGHRDYIASAQQIRNRMADRVVGEAREALLGILKNNNALGVNADPQAADFCSKWSIFADNCVGELRDSTDASQRDARLRLMCYKKIFAQSAQSFKLASTDDRRDAFINMIRLPGSELCMEDTIKIALGGLADRITKDNRIQAPLPPPPAGGAGGGGAASVSPLKDPYNAAVAQAGPGSAPEARVSLKLMADLQTVLAIKHAHDAVSVDIENKIHKYLASVQKFKDGVTLKIKITQISSPARMELPEFYGTKDYFPDDEVTIPRWKLNQKVQFKFVADMSSAPLVLDDLMGKQNQPLQVNLPAKGGGQVVFQFQVIAPPITDETVPPLEKIP